MALECVVFIDEAYSLAGEKRDTRGFDPFGTEAINAIVDFTSEHTGLLSVIAAGYENEMKKQFIEVNPGLERRFPPNLRFKLERYNVKELLKIAATNLNKETKKMDFIRQNILLGCMVTIISRLVWYFDYMRNNDIPNLKKYIEDEVENFINKNIKFEIGEKDVWVFRSSGDWDGGWTVIESEQDEIGQFNNIVVTKGKSQKKIPPFLIRREMEMDVTNRKPYSSYKLNPFVIQTISNINGNRNIIKLLGTVSHDQRKVLNEETNWQGIEWFHLVQMLDASTKLKDGDLFRNQAADINEFTITFLKALARTPPEKTNYLKKFNGRDN